MPQPFPDDEIYTMVADDLGPLLEAFPDGTFGVPDGIFEEGAVMTLSNRPPDSPSDVTPTVHAVPWEYSATVGVRRRGEVVDPRVVTIRGVTIVDVSGGFRRYVDWAEVWAQLGVSSGRGESDSRSRSRSDDQPVRDQVFLAPNGDDVTEQVLA